MRVRGPRCTLAAAAMLALTGCTSTADPRERSAMPSEGPAARGHVVVVVLENKPYSAVIGNASAPYLNGLAQRGTSFTGLRAVAHPSQPNYLALFSGSTHGVTDDSCPQRLRGPTLAGELRSAGLTFAGYSEDLPQAGSPVSSRPSTRASTRRGPTSPIFRAR